MFKSRPLPVNPDGKILFHIGCGELDDKRYINIDTRPAWHIHHVSSIENIGTLFPTGYADLIYCCHVLEHISHRTVPDTLKMLFDCLKPGGILRLAVPDFHIMTKLYMEQQDIRDIIKPLLGGQGYPDNYHYGAFDEKYLTLLLLESGFESIEKWDPYTALYHTFDDQSRHLLVKKYEKEWQISLNIEAVKPFH